MFIVRRVKTKYCETNCTCIGNITPPNDFKNTDNVAKWLYFYLSKVEVFSFLFWTWQILFSLTGIEPSTSQPNIFRLLYVKFCPVYMPLGAIYHKESWFPEKSIEFSVCVLKLLDRHFSNIIYLNNFWILFISYIFWILLNIIYYFHLL